MVPFFGEENGDGSSDLDLDLENLNDKPASTVSQGSQRLRRSERHRRLEWILTARFWPTRRALLGWCAECSVRVVDGVGPSGDPADGTRDVGITAGSLRATLDLVDLRDGPRVHGIVAEKQLPVELLDTWAGWLWTHEDVVLYELEIHTDEKASLTDVSPRGGLMRGFLGTHGWRGHHGRRRAWVGGLRARESGVCGRGRGGLRSSSPCGVFAWLCS